MMDNKRVISTDFEGRYIKLNPLLPGVASGFFM